jgi:AAA domain
MTWDPYIVEEEPAFGEPSSNGDGPQREPSDCDEVSIVSIEEFCSVEEPGAVALVGTAENALIPEDSDIMFYGDGGASKTTLCIDLACHLATPKDWLGHPLANRARVLLIECQGPPQDVPWEAQAQARGVGSVTAGRLDSDPRATMGPVHLCQ